MKFRFYFIFIFVVIILSLTFWSNSNDESLESNIQGKWNIIKATRNGRKTSTFESGYFKFWHSDSIETNILGGKIVSFYHLNKKTIISNSKLPKIIVSKVDNDTLLLKAKISNYAFDFVLKKEQNYDK